ncbi:MAG: SIMPL domain-containing protein, partial [Bacteroidota bacterium]
MYRYFIATVLIILINTTSRAQITSTKSDNQPYIEVNGTAEKEVVPDEIFISITLREKYVDKTKITIDIQEESLINALKNIGIDLSNLYLSDANADYVKVYWQKKDVLTRKDYTLKVSNATAVGNVFIELDKIKITDAYVSKVNH